MLNRLKQRKQGGFTIIEVMIVLAIAALILIIVLLAVPALQRNSRNTTIKNDASTVAGGISTYESDNNGTVPTSIAGTGTITIGTGTSGAPDPNAETVNVNASTNVTTLAAGSGGPSAVTGKCTTGAGGGAGGVTSCPAVGAIDVRPKVDCNSNVSTRSFQILYVIETSSGTNIQCLTG